MKRLFIIGNGFDIAHGVKSDYNKFKEYLEENYDCSYQGIPELIRYPDGSEGYEYDSDVSIIRNKITEIEGEKWSNVEDSLGKLNFSDFFENIDFDKDDIFQQAYRNEDVADILRDSFSNISEYFTEWIESFELNILPRIGISRLINTESKFLTFNYTNLLETVYEINDKDILYIHGNVRKNEKLEFGHGLEVEELGCNGVSYIGEDSINQLTRILKKDTKGILMRNKTFFKNLGMIEEVYSYGFSFGKVDLIYIKEIILKSTNVDTVWYIENFNKHEANQHEICLKRLGFKGNINRFTGSES